MSKSIYLHFFLILLGAQSCSSATEKSEEIEINESPLIDTTEMCFDPDFIEKDDKRSELIKVLNTEIDLSEMKKEVGFLSMGWSINKDFLPDCEADHKNYNYGAVGSLIKKRDAKMIPDAQTLKEAAYKFISIITHKPWTTEKEKYYSTDNEIVIGFESRVNYNHLNELNLVGDSEKEISEQFGIPDLVRDDCYAYKADQKVLVLHLENETVDWMKFINSIK